MLVLPLALRALRWRFGASLGGFVIALVAVLAAVTGPIYLHALDEAVLAERLGQTTQYQRDTFISRASLLNLPNADWELFCV